jgi:type II secretory pathway component PulM
MKWFNQLSTSEIKLIKIGLLFIIPVILWRFVYQPINQSIDLQTRQLSDISKQYEQMLDSQNLIEKQQSNGTDFYRDLNKPFITWIDEQLANKQLSQFVTRSEPKDNQTLIITFESIVFDDLAAWLELLELKYQVNISEVDVTLLDRSSGLCRARITLEENQ